jgi:peptidoglycan/LPS O-acetylase OafA/YrhL
MAQPAVAPPAAPPRLPALDALRAVGSIAVVATHVAFNTNAVKDGVLGAMLARLDVGVALFFALSGFLLFRPWVWAHATGGAQQSTGRYLWRRGLRILPAYWIAVIAGLLLLPRNTDLGADTWIEHMTLIQIYRSGFLADGLGQMWSLCTEVAFYCLLPAMALATLGRTWRPIRTLILIAVMCVVGASGWIAAMGFGVIPLWPMTQWLPPFLPWFGVGMALAVVHTALHTHSAPARFRLVQELAAAPGACMVIALALLGIASTPLVGPVDLSGQSVGEYAMKIILYTMIAALVITPVAFSRPGRLDTLLTTRPAHWLGLVSYGLFLWHPFVLEVIYSPGRRPIFTGDFISTFALVMASGLVLAILSYHLIERPLVRWGNRLPRPARTDAEHGQPQGHHGDQPGQLREGGAVGVSLANG